MSESNKRNTSNKNNKKEPGRTIVISDYFGCPKKNPDGDYLTQVPCKYSFFKAVERFLVRNIKNKIVFMGEFFDRGPYLMDVIINITLLKNTYKKQVIIILGPADIQKLRFKYELDKNLLEKEIIDFPGAKKKVEKNIHFYRGKVIDDTKRIYGEDILYTLTFNDTKIGKKQKVYIQALYQRIINLLQITGGAVMEYCVLINRTLNSLFYQAKRDQNVELQLLCTQIGAFIIVYPFVPEVQQVNYISKRDIQKIIYFLLNSIEKILLKELEYRSDIYINDMYGTYQKLTNLKVDEKKNNDYRYGDVPNLDLWKQYCLDFYESASLIDYDLNTHSIFTYNNNLVLFLESFIQFHDFILRTKDLKDNDYNNNNYYIILNDLYKTYSSLKSAKLYKKVFNDDLEDFSERMLKYEKEIKSLKKKLNEKKILVGGKNKSSGKSDYSGSKSRSSISESSKTKKKLRNTSQNNFSNQSTKKNRRNDNLSKEEKLIELTKDLTKNKYMKISLQQHIDEINNIYRKIVGFDTFTKDETKIHLFLCIQVIYLFTKNNKNEESILGIKNFTYYEPLAVYLYEHKYKNIFIGGFNIGLEFPIVLENVNKLDVNFIINQSIVEIEEDFDKYRGIKYGDDDPEDKDGDEDMKIKHYPISCATHLGEIYITSLTNKGLLKQKKSFLGDIISHTFTDYYLTHKGDYIEPLAIEREFDINLNLEYKRLEASMLPIFKIRQERRDFYQKCYYIPECFIYIVKLNTIDGSSDINFLILDLENINRIGYYMGRLDTWFGFFWNKKRLYQKSIPIEHRDEIKRLFVKYLEKPYTYFPILSPEDNEEQKLQIKENVNNIRESNKDIKFISLRQGASVKIFDKNDFEIEKEEQPTISNKEIEDKLSGNYLSIASFNMSFASDLGASIGSEKDWINTAKKYVKDENIRQLWENSLNTVELFWKGDNYVGKYKPICMAFQELNSREFINKIEGKKIGGYESIIERLGMTYENGYIIYDTSIYDDEKGLLNKLADTNESNIGNKLIEHSKVNKKNKMCYLINPTFIDNYKKCMIIMIIWDTKILGNLVKAEAKNSDINRSRPMMAVYTDKNFHLFNFHSPNIYEIGNTGDKFLKNKCIKESHKYEKNTSNGLKCLDCWFYDKKIEMRQFISNFIKKMELNENFLTIYEKIFIMGDFNDPNYLLLENGDMPQNYGYGFRIDAVSEEKYNLPINNWQLKTCCGSVASSCLNKDDYEKLNDKDKKGIISILDDEAGIFDKKCKDNPDYGGSDDHSTSFATKNYRFGGDYCLIHNDIAFSEFSHFRSLSSQDNKNQISLESDHLCVMSLFKDDLLEIKNKEIQSKQNMFNMNKMRKNKMERISAQDQRREIYTYNDGDLEEILKQHITVKIKGRYKNRKASANSQCRRPSSEIYAVYLNEQNQVNFNTGTNDTESLLELYSHLSDDHDEDEIVAFENNGLPYNNTGKGKLEKKFYFWVCLLSWLKFSKEGGTTVLEKINNTSNQKTNSKKKNSTLIEDELEIIEKMIKKFKGDTITIQNDDSYNFPNKQDMEKACKELDIQITIYNVEKKVPQKSYKSNIKLLVESEYGRQTDKKLHIHMVKFNKNNNNKYYLLTKIPEKKYELKLDVDDCQEIDFRIDFRGISELGDILDNLPENNSPKPINYNAFTRSDKLNINNESNSNSLTTINWSNTESYKYSSIESYNIDKINEEYDELLEQKFKDIKIYKLDKDIKKKQFVIDELKRNKLFYIPTESNGACLFYSLLRIDKIIKKKKNNWPLYHDDMIFNEIPGTKEEVLNLKKALYTYLYFCIRGDTIDDRKTTQQLIRIPNKGVRYLHSISTELNENYEETETRTVETIEKDMDLCFRYIQKMLSSHTMWGGSIEIQLYAEKTNIDISIFNEDRNNPDDFGLYLQKYGSNNEYELQNQFYLYYHGDHFASVLPITILDLKS